MQRADAGSGVEDRTAGEMSDDDAMEQNTSERWKTGDWGLAIGARPAPWPGLVKRERNEGSGGKAVGGLADGELQGELALLPSIKETQASWPTAPSATQAEGTSPKQSRA